MKLNALEIRDDVWGPGNLFVVLSPRSNSSDSFSSKMGVEETCQAYPGGTLNKQLYCLALLLCPLPNGSKSGLEVTHVTLKKSDHGDLRFLESTRSLFALGAYFLQSSKTLVTTLDLITVPVAVQPNRFGSLVLRDEPVCFISTERQRPGCSLYNSRTTMVLIGPVHGNLVQSASLKVRPPPAACGAQMCSLCDDTESS